jgi:D-alanyl-D-alanine carboxypeptidase
MKKLLLIPVFLIGLQSPKAQTFNPLMATMLQDTLNFYTAAITNIKGMSASVYIPGQGIWNGTSGISYTGQPITSDMRFGIASNSKLFCSVMLLKLAENNIISLSDSLKDWLTISNPNINPNITIRQLLNHTSGISDPFFGPPWMDTINANATRVFTPNEVLGWIGAPLFPAGTSWGYSNTNYVLAGMVAQSATGYSLATLIRDSILTPLNMDSTFLDVEEPVNGIIAHRWWNRVVNPVTQDYHDTSRVGLNSAVGYAGSIFSTSAEMVQWYTALFSGQVISQSSMNELTNFLITSNPSYQYGLGLSREVTLGYKYWGHGGRTWGYKSKMIYDTCLQVSVAGLSNSDPSGMDGVTFLLYRAVKNHIPGCPGVITGPTTVTQGQNSVTYTVPAIANATTYIWTLPSGATGTSTTNSITINYGMSAASGIITVRGSGIYGEGSASSLPIIVTTILPTRLTRFDARKQDKNNLLTWTTASEENSEHFIIENSTDGQSFSELATIAAAGISQSEKHYSYLHLDPTTGKNYYRLKSVDLDGNFSYSKVRMLSDENKETRITVYPNPVSDELIIETEETGKAFKIKIFNQTGQIFYTGSGTGKIRIQTNSYAPGIYFIKLESEKSMIIKKIVKE